MQSLNFVKLFRAIALCVVVVLRGLALYVVIVTILLKLLQALDGQHQIFLCVLQIFHALVSESQVVVELRELFALELINIIFVV